VRFLRAGPAANAEQKSPHAPHQTSVETRKNARCSTTLVLAWKSPFGCCRRVSSSESVNLNIEER
jgi:hypothetical protein